MNVIVSNKQKDIIDNVNIDAIKDLNGLFSIDDLLSKFKNYFFSKMILDATSIINFSSREVLEKLATEIGGERLIILLPPSPEPPPEFVNKLIDLKIYNFSTNINDVVRFLTNPNTAETFANSRYDGNEQIYVDNSIKANNDFENPSVPFENHDMSGGFSNQNYSNNNEFNSIVSPMNQYSLPQDSFNNSLMQNSGQNFPMGIPQTSNNQNIPVGIPQTSNNQNIPVGIPQTSNNQNIPVGIPQTNNNQNTAINFSPMENQGFPMGQNGYSSMMNKMTNGSINYMNGNSMLQNSMTQGNNFRQPMMQNNSQVNNMSRQDQFLNINNGNNINVSGIYNGDKKVYGIKNVTPHAGSTTLTYLLMKEVSNLGKKVLAVEIDKHDFIYFQSRNNMVSVESQNILNVLAKADAEIVFVDLNNYHDFSICDEVLYLIEPSTIKLNLLMAKNRFAFKALANKKIVLNKSMLSNTDVKILSNEAGTDFLMNIPPLNDRINNKIIADLFYKL